jgi:hypothetical protein
MAYDVVLVERIRELLAGDLDVTDKRMFGGVAFLTGGHLAVAASGNGGLMARVDPQDTDELVRRDGVTRMVMGGREMNGWLRVDEEQLGDDSLAEWVYRGLDFARSLPPKAG